MTETLRHPSIGPIVGKAADGIVQFLGVKYASLTDRLAEPRLLSNYNGQGLDATEIGPQAVSPSNGCDIEFGLIQQRLPRSTFKVSGLHCLHVNITMPSGSKNLPVLVFIHGGGFAVGSNAWPQYNFTRLVKLSVELGEPIVAVAVKCYRLGIPGFLTSTELTAAGYKANNGLRDQRVALEWVKHYIRGFGGAEDKITLMGQSAGAVASILHLQSRESLFQQLVVMSGTPLGLPPLSLPIADAAYSLSLKALNLHGLSMEDRVKEIVQGQVSNLCGIIPDIPLLPVIDNDVISQRPTYEGIAQASEAEFPGMRWCRRILIGDCQFDGSIFSAAMEKHKPGIANAFHLSLLQSLSFSLATVEHLQEAYDIIPGMPDDTAIRNILKFASDIRFYAPTRAIADSWPGTAYLYHFNEPNPWEGYWKGEASHNIDVVHLLRNFEEYFPPAQRRCAQKFTEHVLAFVNGKEPFPDRQLIKNGAMVYGSPAETATFVESRSAADFGRRQVVFDLAEEVGLEALNRSFSEFLSRA
ncbi:hypothetical protein PEBR_21898 [Penicillium brasilianum]|uniref:Carboxylic ester hydrolase n=1 Tax=Penicillium brasilianum TaxID=104259 RepID=A0A1S9RLF1_PENBI|nr:hypothetical protein PEBR_21898 [Penicillium brasilianum]